MNDKTILIITSLVCVAILSFMWFWLLTKIDKLRDDTMMSFLQETAKLRTKLLSQLDYINDRIVEVAKSAKQTPPEACQQKEDVISPPKMTFDELFGYLNTEVIVLTDKEYEFQDKFEIQYLTRTVIIKKRRGIK